ncbi:MAG: zinc ribbon domain-containing protein [Defluviitaleaceae bacterium]|nr:zinc ribbon domain-containing protein [Defluviitaleaceae bacterium]
MKFCPSCGNELAADSRFCAGCGAAVDGGAASPSTTASPNAAMAAATAAASTALGFFKSFVKSPATAIKTSSINQPEGIIYIALLPVSMILFLYAFMWRAVGDLVKEIAMSAIFELLIHTAVWFAILIVIPLLAYKVLFDNEEKIAISDIFPVFAAATLPVTVNYILGTVGMLFNISVGFGLFLVGAFGFGSIAFWILHATAVKRTFNVTNEQTVYSSILTYVVATAYCAFGMGRVLSGFFGSLTDLIYGGLW